MLEGSTFTVGNSWVESKSVLRWARIVKRVVWFGLVHGLLGFTNHKVQTVTELFARKEMICFVQFMPSGKHMPS